MLFITFTNLTITDLLYMAYSFLPIRDSGLDPVDLNLVVQVNRELVPGGSVFPLGAVIDDLR